MTDNKEELIPFRVTASKFLGSSDFGTYTYEISFNQSLVHIGRFTGIENGLNEYREKEISDEENAILEEAEKIKKKYSKDYE
jgi:hypothetical protein